MGVGRQILDNHELQLAQLLVGTLMMLGEHLDVIVVGRAVVQQRLHIGEERLLLILHVATNLLRILIIELHDEPSQLVVLADAFLQLATDERQLEIKVIGMTGLQIVQQGRHADLLVILIVGEVVDGKVNHSQKRIGIHPIHLARLSHRLVAKAQIDAKAAQRLQYAVIVLDKRYHLILRFIHLQILHHSIPYYIIDCAKVSIFAEICNISTPIFTTRSYACPLISS